MAEIATMIRSVVATEIAATNTNNNQDRNVVNIDCSSTASGDNGGPPGPPDTPPGQDDEADKEAETAGKAATSKRAPKK